MYSANGNYQTRQDYTYNNLYQLVKVEGNTTYNPYHSTVPEYKSKYSQVFEFDTEGLGNMLNKVSSESVTPQKNIGDNLNYSLGYVYDTNYAHRLINAGNRFYKYDSNGNIICEQDGDFDGSDGDVSYHKISRETDDVYSTDYGWGLFKEEETNGGIKGSKYHRTYTWNERNQLVSSVDANYSTSYIYGQDGQRTNKYTQNSETLYFNKMWTHHTDSGNSVYGGQTSKNIYLGETRIVTKLNSGNDPEYQEEYWKQYYYHSDHLGSASLISDYKGDEYQRIEYTPYGETWVEKTDPQANLNFLPYRFTSKEMDEETGLYYYGARYLDPKYSMWISTDPALGEYIPQAPVSEEARKNNQNLPGMGGVFNHINSNLYHYAGNNPVRYIDPDGRYEFDVENGIIYCDLTNSEDCILASTAYVMFENRDFPICIARDTNSGLYLQFTNSESMVNFVADNCYDPNYGAKIENFIDTLGSFSTLSETANIPNIPNISNISTGLGIVSILIDVNKTIENPSISNKIDVGLDAVGLIGGIAGSTYVPLLSIYLSCTKTELEWWIKTMAEGTVEINNRAKQYQYEKMLEEMEKYDR